MMKVTKAMVKAGFLRWCKAMGLRPAKTHNDVGAYELDYNPTYGGYAIQRIINLGGGVSTITHRMSPRVFVDSLDFAVNSRNLGKHYIS